MKPLIICVLCFTNGKIVSCCRSEETIAMISIFHRPKSAHRRVEIAFKFHMQQFTAASQLTFDDVINFSSEIQINCRQSNGQVQATFRSCVEIPVCIRRNWLRNTKFQHFQGFDDVIASANYLMRILLTRLVYVCEKSSERSERKWKIIQVDDFSHLEILVYQLTKSFSDYRRWWITWTR